MIYVLDGPEISTSTTQPAPRHRPVAHMEDTREEALDNHSKDVVGATLQDEVVGVRFLAVHRIL